MKNFNSVRLVDFSSSQFSFEKYETNFYMNIEHISNVISIFNKKIFIFHFDCKGPSAGGAVKIANVAGSDGFWVDPSGIMWRSNPHMKDGNLIPDYAPVCTATITTTTLPVDDDSRTR